MSGDWNKEATSPDGAPPGIPQWALIQVVDHEGAALFFRDPVAVDGWTKGAHNFGSQSKPGVMAAAMRVIVVGYRRRWIETDIDSGKDTREWFAWKDEGRKPRGASHESPKGCRLRSHGQLLLVPASGTFEPLILTGKGYQTDDLWSVLAVPSALAAQATRTSGRPIGAWQWGITLTAAIRQKGKNRIAHPKAEATQPDAAWCGPRSLEAAAFSRSPEAIAWANEWLDTPTAGDEVEHG